MQRIVSYLFVNFCQLIEIVLEEGDLLLLGNATTEIVVFVLRLFLRLEERAEVTFAHRAARQERTFFNRDWRSCTNSLRRLWRVCNSLATVSSRPLRSCLACSRRSCCKLERHASATKIDALEPKATYVISCRRLDLSVSSFFSLS